MSVPDVRISVTKTHESACPKVFVNGREYSRHMGERRARRVARKLARAQGLVVQPHADPPFREPYLPWERNKVVVAVPLVTYARTRPAKQGKPAAPPLDPSNHSA